MKQIDKRQVAGWIAVGISTAITCFWAFWGVIENFHEGWYAESLLSNLGLMFVQYLSPMLIFMGVTLISIYWPRLGGVLHGIIAFFAAWFFHAFTNPVMFLLTAAADWDWCALLVRSSTATKDRCLPGCLSSHACPHHIWHRTCPASVPTH